MNQRLTTRITGSGRRKPINKLSQGSLPIARLAFLVLSPANYFAGWAVGGRMLFRRKYMACSE
jgi:hypothetical protein